MSGYDGGEYEPRKKWSHIKRCYSDGYDPVSGRYDDDDDDDKERVVYNLNYMTPIQPKDFMTLSKPREKTRAEKDEKLKLKQRLQEDIKLFEMILQEIKSIQKSKNRQLTRQEILEQMQKSIHKHYNR